MAKSKKLKAALIGFGGMGHFHSTCYAKQKNLELVAICDQDPESFKKTEEEINIGASGKTDLSKIKQCYSYEELIKNVDFDVLDICLPCPLHAEYAIRAMKDGYHVICEKPMARNTKDAMQMIRTSKKTGKKLMIAQCLRFMPSYQFMKEALDNGTYGKLLRLDMRRCGSLPGQAWYRDPAQSGGALLDLHLHDTDYINYLLGVPASVQTFGIARDTGGIDDLMTNYEYPEGPVANSEGSWCKGTWACSTIGVFEKATVEIYGTNTVKVFRLDVKGCEEHKFAEKDANPYFNEIAYFAECILKNQDPVRCMPESTLTSIRIAEAEEKSARARGKKVALA